MDRQYRSDVTHPATWKSTQGLQAPCASLGAVVRARNKLLLTWDRATESPAGLALAMQSLALSCGAKVRDAAVALALTGAGVRRDVVARLQAGSSLARPLDRLLAFALALPMTGTEEWAWVAMPGLAEAAVARRGSLTPRQRAILHRVLAQREGSPIH